MNYNDYDDYNNYSNSLLVDVCLINNNKRDVLLTKRIFMLVNYTPNDKSIGITKKISAEINAFRQLGCEVFYSAYTEDGIVIYDNEDKAIYINRYKIHNKKYQYLRRSFLLSSTVASYMKQTDVFFDYCYGRLWAPSRTYLCALRAIKNKKAFVILESLAYFPGMKFSNIKGKYTILEINKHKRKLQKYVDLFLTEGSFDTLYGIKAKESYIGVDTNNITIHAYSGNDNEINMISVGNEAVYHGYDRLIKSLYHYRKDGGDKRIYIHFVGKMSDETISLVNKLSLDNVIHFYGKRYGAELDEIYNKCNMAVGPIAQHRMGGKKDTGLKTKEYLAKGIPYFYSGNELPELKGFPYIHQVASDESLIDFEEIWSFYESYRYDKNVISAMRSFAMDKLSWINFLREVLEEADTMRK